jgi:NDP-sugar pyrophosphorylase family protein
MRLFGHHGLNRFVLCLGYKGSMIKDYFLNYEAMTQDCTVAVGGRHIHRRFSLACCQWGELAAGPT